MSLFNIQRTPLLVALALSASFARTSAAQVPTSLPFSGSLTTAAGPVDGAISITFRLFDAETNGSQVWTETHTTTAANGLVLADLGTAGQPLSAAIFDGTPLWLEVQINAEVLSPRSAIGSVPYALHAAEADFASVASSADDAAALGGLGPASYQRALTASCSSGSYLRGISASGVPTCSADAGLTNLSAGTGISISGSGSSRTVAVKGSGITRTEINGTEVQVYQAAPGCGGGLSTSSSCKTLACPFPGVSTGYYQCIGVCAPLGQPADCTGLPSVGWLLSPSI
ncbi:MAG: hypothetical protein H6718_28165 [Polyangiaceae bacterium]|nr:hypothetical protein [Myxococcales bacterium]MCB9589323.1 hypothetical protein [Polyangiaceae bacterium]